MAATKRDFSFLHDNSQDNKTADTDMRWYVVHTYSTYENKVKQYLEKKIENSNLGETVEKIIIPMVEEKDVGESKVELKKSFPGYILVKMKYTKETWYVIRNAPGVTGFVGPDPMNPTPLTPEEAMVLKLDLDKNNSSLFVNLFKENDRISVISGPLAGNEGVVIADLPDKKCIKALVSMFGRNITAELEYIQVKKED